MVKRQQVFTPRRCACGGVPGWERAVQRARFTGRALERLACQRCGNGVGPLASRQLLRNEWNLYGYRAGQKAEGGELKAEGRTA